jgi:hypothetical protein
VNLCNLYSYKLIGKLTAFLQLQEFSLHDQTLDSFTSTARRSPHNLNPRLATFSLRLPHYKYRRLTFSVTITHSPITLANLSSINLVSIFRCSSLPHNPVYARRVDPSALAFSLSSHRHSCISLSFSSRFIVS